MRSQASLLARRSGLEKQGEFLTVVGEMRPRDELQSGRSGRVHGRLKEQIHFAEGRDTRGFEGENHETTRIEIFRQTTDLTDGFERVAVHVRENRVIGHARVRLEGGHVHQGEMQARLRVEPLVEWRAVDGGHLVAAAEQLGGHAAGAGSEFEPVAAFFERRPVHLQVMECLGDFCAGAADRVRRVLTDEFGAARVESVGCLRALHSAEQAFFPDEAKQSRPPAILGFYVFERGDFRGKKLKRPAAEIGGECLVIAVRGARIELADEDRLRIAATEFPKHRLRRLFYEALHGLRIARPRMVDRQIPAEISGGFRLMNGRRVRRLNQIILTAQLLGNFPAESFNDVSRKFRENLGNTNQPFYGRRGRCGRCQNTGISKTGDTLPPQRAQPLYFPSTSQRLRSS